MWIYDAIIGGYGPFRHEPASMRVCPGSPESLHHLGAQLRDSSFTAVEERAPGWRIHGRKIAMGYMGECQSRLDRRQVTD
jgi:hypothetical protein